MGGVRTDGCQQFALRNIRHRGSSFGEFFVGIAQACSYQQTYQGHGFDLNPDGMPPNLGRNWWHILVFTNYVETALAVSSTFPVVRQLLK